MHTVHPASFSISRLALSLAALMLAVTCSTANAAAIETTLSGTQEVPPVETSASGTAKFMLKADRALSGSVKTKGVDGTAAHIHEGGPGANGTALITLEKKNDHEWTVPVGAKLTADQVTALKAGTLYVNVHSDAHKGGEIRGQLKQ